MQVIFCCGPHCQWIHKMEIWPGSWWSSHEQRRLTSATTMILYEGEQVMICMSSGCHDVYYSSSIPGCEMEVDQCIDYLVGRPYVSLRQIFIPVDTFKVYWPTWQWVDKVSYVRTGRTKTEYGTFHVQNKDSVYACHMSSADSGQVSDISGSCQYNVRYFAPPANYIWLEYLST